MCGVVGIGPGVGLWSVQTRWAEWPPSVLWYSVIQQENTSRRKALQMHILIRKNRTSTCSGKAGESEQQEVMRKGDL